jgi:hypothetical protein
LAFTGFEVIRHRFARRRFVTTNDFIFAIGSENLWLGERSPRWRGPQVNRTQQMTPSFRGAAQRRTRNPELITARLPDVRCTSEVRAGARPEMTGKITPLTLS